MLNCVHQTSLPHLITRETLICCWIWDVRSWGGLTGSSPESHDIREKGGKGQLDDTGRPCTVIHKPPGKPLPPQPSVKLINSSYLWSKWVWWGREWLRHWTLYPLMHSGAKATSNGSRKWMQRDKLEEQSPKDSQKWRESLWTLPSHEIGIWVKINWKSNE